jgi:hypothetical protein
MGDKKEKKIDYINQPTSHTDGINVGCRLEGSIYLQLFSDAPDRLIENHRTLMSRDVAIKLIDILCGALDHYPEKSSKTVEET